MKHSKIAFKILKKHLCLKLNSGLDISTTVKWSSKQKVKDKIKKFTYAVRF